MADQFHEFDRVFRDRLRDQTATPPDSVWNNIQAERTFGHIIANKISSTWRIIGTLLLLATAGGASALLMNQEEISPAREKTTSIEQNENPLQYINLCELGSGAFKPKSHSWPGKIQINIREPNIYLY